MARNAPVESRERNLYERDFFLLWAGAAISLSEIWAGGLLASFGLAAGLGIILLGHLLGNGKENHLKLLHIGIVNHK